MQKRVFNKTAGQLVDFHSTIVLPNESITTVLAFNPPNKDIKGKWELSMYEVPVATDIAGNVSETNHFFAKRDVKKWEITFKRFKKGEKMKQIKKVEL